MVVLTHPLYILRDTAASFTRHDAKGVFCGQPPRVFSPYQWLNMASRAPTVELWHGGHICSHSPNTLVSIRPPLLWLLGVDEYKGRRAEKGKFCNPRMSSTQSLKPSSPPKPLFKMGNPQLDIMDTQRSDTTRRKVIVVPFHCCLD
jgi:hypothetical protein